MENELNMATAKFDIKTEATRPLYAYVGVTDRAVEAVRGSLAIGQKRLADVQEDARQIDLDPQALRAQATSLVNERVDSLTTEAKNRRAAVEARITELQKTAQSVPARVQAVLAERELTYGQLVNRGETLVERIRNQRSTKETTRNAKTTSSKAKSTATQAEKAAETTASSAKGAAKSATTTAKKQASRPKSSAKATGTAAKKTATSAAQATKDAAEKVGD